MRTEGAIKVTMMEERFSILIGCADPTAGVPRYVCACVRLLPYPYSQDVIGPQPLYARFPSPATMDASEADASLKRGTDVRCGRKGCLHVLAFSDFVRTRKAVRSFQICHSRCFHMSMCARCRRIARFLWLLGRGLAIA